MHIHYAIRLPQEDLNGWYSRDQSLCELQDQGYTLDKIEKVLRNVQLVCNTFVGMETWIPNTPMNNQVPSAMDLLKALKAKNARVLVLSDANTHFIDIILKVHFMCLCVIIVRV